MKNDTRLEPILDFSPRLVDALPNTYAILRLAHLVVHPLVSKIVLHGSRGLAGGCRPDSDIDLSLLVDLPENPGSDSLFRKITKTTLDHWQADIEIDLAIVYDQKRCGLPCFEQSTWQPDFCQRGGVDCFGLYKIQKGFQGFVTNAGIEVRRMYPSLKIWQRNG